MNKELEPALTGVTGLTELRTQAFLPWSEKMWDSPNVAHDNPGTARFHASIIMGFAGADDRDNFFTAGGAGGVSSLLAPAVSAIHAYDVAKNADLRPGWPETDRTGMRVSSSSR